MFGYPKFVRSKSAGYVREAKFNLEKVEHLKKKLGKDFERKIQVRGKEMKN